jgi:hypothetical protein
MSANEKISWQEIIPEDRSTLPDLGTDVLVDSAEGRMYVAHLFKPDPESDYVLFSVDIPSGGNTGMGYKDCYHEAIRVIRWSPLNR